MVFRLSYYMLRRMLRGYLALIILMLTPLALITVLGLIAGNAVNPSGIPIMDTIAITMILAFQLYGGFYTMDFIKVDFFSQRKWKMRSLPYPPNIFALSVFFSCTLFSALQGFVMVIFTQYVYGVYWGSWGLILLMLMAISLFTQLIYLIIILLVKNYKVAEGLGTCYALVSMGLSGVWFPMPRVQPFIFLTSYGNPLSLGQNIVYAIIKGEGLDKAFISMAILLSSSVVLSVVAAYLGRRKLA